MTIIKKISFLSLLLVAVAHAQVTISNVGVTAMSSTTATISWTTSGPATSFVKYGTTSLQNQAGSATLVTSHSVQLPALTGGVTYIYQAGSVDSFGNQTLSTIQSFTLCSGTGTANLSGTVNNYYAYGNYTITWVNDSGQSVSPTLCGTALQQTFTGNFDGGGSLTIPIPDNYQIVPSPSHWHVAITGIDGSIGATSTNFSTNGGSLNISAQLQTAASGNLTFVWHDPNTGVFYPPVGGSGSVAWGAITGTLSNQTDLQNALNAKLNLSGGTMTGDLTVPNLIATNTVSGLTISGTTITASGALQGASITDTGLTAGQCVQAGTGGLLTVTGAACSSGSVTNIGMTVPGALLAVTPSSITSTGTFAVTLVTQATGNQAFLTPDGASGTPTFRSILAADLPATVAYTNVANTFTQTQTATIFNATTSPYYEVNGVQIAASNLSNGTTGTGAIMLAASPTTTGTLTAANINASTVSAGTLTATGLTAGQCVQAGTGGLLTVTGSACGSGGGGGVSSISMVVPTSFLGVTPSTITTSGTFTISLNSQSANLAFLSPDGTSGDPTFRSILASDLPATIAYTNVSNTFTQTQNGTIFNATTSPYYEVNGAQISAANLSNGTTGTGAVVLATSPTITGTLTAGTINATIFNATTSPYYKVNGTQISAANLSNGTTGTGAVVLAGSPTITGILSAATISATGTISAANQISATIAGAGSQTAIGGFYGTGATTAGNQSSIEIGVSTGVNYESAHFGLVYNAAASTTNFATIGLTGRENILNLFGTGHVEIGSTTDHGYALTATGDINTTGVYRVNGTQIAASNLSNGTTGSGSIVLASSASTTVNGQTCALGSTCTITASATGITVGSTTVSSGTSGYVLYDNAGTLGNLATTGSGSVVLQTSPTINTSLTVSGSGTAFQLSDSTTTSGSIATFLSPSLSTGNFAAIQLGTALTTNNAMGLLYHYVGSGSTSNYLEFDFAGSSTSMSLFASGNVSIGTTTDESVKLYVAGGMRAGTFIGTLDTTTTSGNAVVIQGFAQNMGTGGYIYEQLGVAATTNNAGNIRFAYSGGSGSLSNALEFGFSGNDGLMTIFASGDVAIGQTTDSGYKLTVNGSIATSSSSGSLLSNDDIKWNTFNASTTNQLCYGNSGVSGYQYQIATCSSLAKYKANVETLDSETTLNQLLKLRPVNYRSKTTYRDELGFIAEEAVKVNPRIATYDNDGGLVGLDYGHITALLVSGFQHQEKEIDALKEEIKQLKNK